jgi:glucose-1-phosphate cytidylyltransferase
MKTVILAGGLGTRLSEETALKPKPMVKIGEMPILWHIMKIYSSFGFNDFVICCGYKGVVIKKFFADYSLEKSDVTFDLINGNIDVHKKTSEPWKVTLVDTGLDTMTGGRLKRVEKYLDAEPFFFTYGDTLTDVNISNLLDYHKKQKKLATVTAVQPVGRFGKFDIREGVIEKFQEKSSGDGNWVNGGFFVLEPDVIDYIKDENTSWEGEPLQKLTKEDQFSAYKHTGFYQPMDTLRDKLYLEDLWKSKKAQWKVWN